MTFNILGFGTNCGRWLKHIPKFIRDEARTAGKQHKCWVLYMKEIPNFCTVFDLDFRFHYTTCPRKIEDDVLIEFGGKLRTLVQDQLGKSVDVLLTRKLNRAAVPVTIRGEKVFKGGCHFYLLEHRFTKIEVTELRKSLEEMLPSWNCLGPIIDEGVYPLGSTGIMMIHSPKKLGACYDSCVAVISNYVQLITSHAAKDLKRMYKRIISNDCYISPRKMTITHNVRESPTDTLATRTDFFDCERNVLDDFHLPYFLSLVQTLDNEDWKGLMYFLKLSNLSTDFICNSMNKHFKPKDLHENRRILKGRKSSFRKHIYKIKRANVVRILKRKDINYNYVDLFFPHKCRFIDNVFELCHKSIVLPRRTLDRKLKECFCYVMHQKACLHYKILIPIEGGEEQWRIGHVVSTAKTDNRNIYVYDLDYVKELQKENPMQIDLYVRANNLAKKHTLSKIIQDMLLEEEFKTYKQTICRPYLDSWTGISSQLNIWELPELFYYKPTAKVDIKKTSIWYHLTNILCWGNEYKIKWLFSCVAEKIQNPGRKLNKILNFVSESNGAGKSSFFYFVVGLLGVNKTFELKDLSQLHEKFNSWQQNVLWVLVDDIESMTKKEHEMLKSLCTARQMKIERKNCDSVQAPCSYDTIITSNHQKNFYSNSEDRRNEMIIVNATMCDKKFWDKFYEELKDKNCMKAFFEYFRQYKIPLDVHQKTCRFDKKALQERVADSLEITHEFLRILFEADTFFRPTKAASHEIEIFPNGYFYVTKHYLLRSLCQWEQSNNGRKQITMKTMLDSLKKLDITLEKRRCNIYFAEKQPRRILLSQKTIEQKLIERHDTSFSFPDFGFKESCLGLIDDLIQKRSDMILTMDQIEEKCPTLDYSIKKFGMTGFAVRDNLLNSMTVSGFCRKQFLMRHADKNSS